MTPARDNSRMTPCAEFERRLTLYAWDELEPSDRAAVEQHVAACPACAGVLARERTLLEQVSSLVPEQPADLLVAQCRRSLAHNLDRADASGRWLKRWKAAFRPGAWLIAHPAWTVATLVLFGFLAGRIASRATMSVGPGMPGMDVAESATGEGAASSPLESSSVTGIERLPGGAVAVRMQTEKPVVVEGMLDDGAIRRALLSALQASDRPDPDARLESVDLLRPSRTDQAVRSALCYAALHDTNPSVRLKDVEALRGLEQESEVRQTLLQALEHDPNPGVRVEAVSSLRTFLDASPSDDAWTRDASLVRILRESQRKDPNEFVRLQSDAAIRQISARNPQ
ncbi:MAG TPA: HEAT repeat domain-containing protein [Candidatus Acidoferrales bacterium]|nr:HEAT repeat domain-containing protein [Candidatus Acidoferrales bacterium]